jgi:Ca2+-transporting ATPase
VLVILVAMYGVALRRGQGEQEARALAFTTLIIANLGLILTNRSWSRTMLGTLRSRNAALWWVVGGALVFLGLVLYVPFLRELFRFSKLHFEDLALCLTAGAISIIWFELFKVISQHKSARG